MRKPAKIFETVDNMVKTSAMAKEALRNGLGPASNSDKTYGTIPGEFINKVCYVIIMERGENGNRSKPVDWYAYSDKPNFPSGFGGWYNYSYDEFIKANPWVKEEMDWLDSLKK